MSASSLCVTWGMLTQEACSRGPEIFLMRESGMVSIGPNLAKSTCGTSGSAPPPAAGAAAPLAERRLHVLAGDAALLAGALELIEIEAEFARQPPHRGAGVDAGEIGERGARPQPSAAGAADRLARRAGSRALRRRPPLPSLPPRRPVRRGCRADPPASSFTTSEPIDTLSPTLTTISVILPAAGDGTSMVALSDSSVTSGCSASTVSPALTRISMTGTSLKSPMSGTVTSIVAALAGAGAAALAGLAAPWPALFSGAAERGRLGGSGLGLRLALRRLMRAIERAHRHFVADLGDDLRDRARHRRGHVHRRLVGFERDQRLLGLDDVARLHQDLDDRHVLEVADIGNFHFDLRHRRSPSRTDWFTDAEISASRRVRPLRVDAVFGDRLGHAPLGSN